MGIVGYKNIALSGHVVGDLHAADYIDFYDARTCPLDELPIDRPEQNGWRRQSRQLQSISEGCTFRVSFHLVRSLRIGEEPNIPPTSPIIMAKIYNPSPGGYCQIYQSRA